MPARHRPPRTVSAAATPASAGAADPRGEWLLLVHQLPPGPSNSRVKTWRRLQEIGAVAVRNAVYVLPNSAQAREDFAWIRQEVLGMGGQATVFVGDAADEAERLAIVEVLRRARTADYEALSRDVEALARRVRRARVDEGADGRRRDLAALRDRLRAIEAVDFFTAAGGDDVRQAVADLEGRMSGTPAAAARRPAASSRAEYQNRVWVTRRRPGVDRMASAWLIRKFVDSAASFTFARRDDGPGPDQVPFDMYVGEFSHQGGKCTFEVLVDRFGIDDVAVARMAEIVHDVDLKDQRYQPSEATTIGALVEGIRQACGEDADALQQGIAMFDALYRSFETAGSTRSAARKRPAPKRARQGRRRA